MAKRTKGSKQQGYVVEWFGDEIEHALNSEIDDALFEAALTLVELARAKAPRDEGTLQESGYAASVTQSTYRKRPYHKGERRPRQGVAVAAFSAPHSHLIEFGTRKMRAHPFFRPAFDGGKPTIINAAVMRLRERMGRLKRG